MEQLYRAYKDNKKVAIYFIYVDEAHPARRAGGNGIADHKTLDDRIKAALKCVKGLKLTVPVLVDALDKKTQNEYGVWQACTTVIDPQGKVAFYAHGSRGTRPKEAKQTIDKLLQSK